MPDHWAPLALVGRTRRYPLIRVARLSGLAGAAHVLVSLLLGAIIIAVGLQFRSAVEHAQNSIVGAVLIATGLALLGVDLRGRGHRHSHHHGHDHSGHEKHDHARGEGRGRALAGIMIPFGAAASPDLTILPVFLAASAAGAGTALGSLVAFASVTIATIVALTLLATVGGYQVRGGWLERRANAVTAATLMIIGTLVATGAI
jgi:hypothetical protein